MPTDRTPKLRSAEITPQPLYLRRREFLRSAGMMVGATLTGAIALPDSAAAQTPRGARLAVGKHLVTTTDSLNSYRDVTTYCNYYEFGSDKSDPARNAAAFKPTPWSVTVDGLCGKPGTYTLEDILKSHALEERIYRLRCVEAWSMVIPWVGFPLGDLLKRFQPAGSAKFVEFTTVLRPSEMAGQRLRFPSLLPWPYTEGLRMDEAMHPLAIIAVGLYGETLLNQNGAPLRLVVPWKYGFKSIKSIVRIRFVAKQPVNTWRAQVPHWYGFYANVNPTVDNVEWSQKTERRIGELLQRRTLMFNGYGEQVASLYAGMDLRKDF